MFRAAHRDHRTSHVPLRDAFTHAKREILFAAGSVTFIFALFYTGTTYLTSYGTSPTGAALSRTLVLSLGIVAGAVMALGVILSAIYSDRFGRRILIMASCAAAVVWSLLLFPLLDTRSPVAFAIGLIVTLGIMGLPTAQSERSSPRRSPPGTATPGLARATAWPASWAARFHRWCPRHWRQRSAALPSACCCVGSRCSACSAPQPSPRQETGICGRLSRAFRSSGKARHVPHLRVRGRWASSAPESGA